MNREIKFRVWSLDEKEWMKYPTQEDFISQKEDFNNIFDNENVVFQQFTGLKDKNGKEIYEGDIIIFMGKWDEKGNVLKPDYAPYQIIWLGGGCHAQLIQPSSPRSFHIHNEILFIGHTDNKIIGNIFENPEIKNEILEKQRQKLINELSL